MADQWVLVSRPRSAVALAVVQVAAGDPVVATPTTTGWSVAGREIPGGVTVSAEVARLAEAGDDPGTAELSRRLGAWLTAEAAPVVHFDQLIDTGDGFVIGWTAVAEQAPSPAIALAAGWFLELEAVIAEHRRHSWPPWVLGEPLVRTQLEAAGLHVTDDDILSARGLADELAARLRPEPEPSDRRRSEADVAALEMQIHELQGHIFGLERTLKFRDGQLKDGWTPPPPAPPPPPAHELSTRQLGVAFTKRVVPPPVYRTTVGGLKQVAKIKGVKRVRKWLRRR